MWYRKATLIACIGALCAALATGTALRAEDCNENGIEDSCDIDCGSSGGPCDVPGCGGSADCNENGVPDECDLVGSATASVFATGFAVPEDIVPSTGDYPPGFFVPDAITYEVHHMPAEGGESAVFADIGVTTIGGTMTPSEFGNQGARLLVTAWGSSVLWIHPDGTITPFALVEAGTIYGLVYVPESIGGPAAGQLVVTAHDGSISAVDESGTASVLLPAGDTNLFTPRLSVADFGDYDHHVFVGDPGNGDLYSLDLHAIELSHFARLPVLAEDGGLRQLAFSPPGWAAPLEPALGDQRVLLVSVSGGSQGGGVGEVMVLDHAGGIVAQMTEGPDGATFDPRGITFLGDEILISDSNQGILMHATVHDFHLRDCNLNSIPDTCDVAEGTGDDCNGNSAPDECDIAEGTSQDENENGIPDECELSIVSSDPLDGAIDARQPTEVDGSGNYGWSDVELIFDDDVNGLTPEDFTITLDPPGTPPYLAFVYTEGNVAWLQFGDFAAEPIPPGHWTIITHNDSGSAVRLGYLPADANGDRTSAPLDILALIDFLNGVGEPLEVWQSDTDRSGEPNAADILRVIDLLNGAGEFDTWNGQSLPE